ncbi:hypothetical protein Trco_001380 [Trichoderma cornu-damae]|uniref:Uncharacterized protein n=1 Tax=Trichoderma cornu-damae TaxID=654480 RepID=A0A9P8QS81_9HYPO|nr:hypothetical protein Trco_001380 [Trichoderma cornu-damae]
MSWNDSANRPAPYPVPVPQQHPPQRRQRYSRLQPQLRALSPNRQQDATPRPSARQRHSHSSNPSFLTML